MHGAMKERTVTTMTDLIRRADAIDAICMNDCGGCRPNECGAYLDKSCDVVKVISALPSAEAVQGWIPCSERLPDVDVEVITTTDWSEILIAWLRKGGAWETDEYILANDEILAWMPLPKPYKGGDDE